MGRRISIAILVSGLLAGPAGAAHAGAVDAEDAADDDVTGWAREEEPTGLAHRSDPAPIPGRRGWQVASGLALGAAGAYAGGAAGWRLSTHLEVRFPWDLDLLLLGSFTGLGIGGMLGVQIVGGVLTGEPFEGTSGAVIGALGGVAAGFVITRLVLVTPLNICLQHGPVSPCGTFLLFSPLLIGMAVSSLALPVIGALVGWEEVLRRLGRPSSPDRDRRRDRSSLYRVRAAG